jgi:PGF-CTERM protein
VGAGDAPEEFGMNDAPVILEVSPKDGTYFEEGKTIEFSVVVEDPDGDELTVTWKDGDKVIGTGRTLKYSKLGTGLRRISVTVSDGEDSTSEEIRLMIEEKEDSPGLGPVVALAAVLLTGLVVRRLR